MMDQSVRGTLADTAAALAIADPPTAATLNSYVQVLVGLSLLRAESKLRPRAGRQPHEELVVEETCCSAAQLSHACMPTWQLCSGPHPCRPPCSLRLPPQAIDSTHSALAAFSSFGSDLDSIQANTAGTIDGKIDEYRDIMDTADSWFVPCWAVCAMGSAVQHAVPLQQPAVRPTRLICTASPTPCHGV